MTTTERLIRTACELKKGDIHADYQKDVKALPERSMPLSKAPALVRRLYQKLVTLDAERAAVVEQYEQLGFDAPHKIGETCDGADPTIYLDYKVHNAAQEKAAEHRKERVAKVEALRNEHAIAALGQDAKAGKVILERLKKALERV